MEYQERVINLFKNDPALLKGYKKSKLAVTLVEAIEKEIIEFDYTKKLNWQYLFDIFNQLPDLMKGNITLQLELNDKLTYMHNMLRNLIHSKPSNLPDEDNYNLLKQLIEKMENCLLRIYYDSPADYNPDKEEFIEHIVFTAKSLTCLKVACSKYPYIINSFDELGIPLVERVLDAYLMALNNYLSKVNLGPLDDLLYYDEVMKVIFAGKIKIDSYSRERLLTKIKDFVLRQNILSPRHKEKLSFFANNIINTIMETYQEQTIDYLSYKCEIHTKFKEAHMLEANRIYMTNKNIGPASSMRHIISFDCENAKEIDDCLSISLSDGIYHLGVHIANPSAYIDFNSILMDEALRRTTSIYLDQCIPMFPPILSENVMSLNKNANRYVHSYYFDIDATTHELCHFEIKREIVTIYDNLENKDFDRILKRGCNDPILENTVILLNKVAEILKQAYSLNAIYAKVNADDTPQTQGGSVVESAMIYTNLNVAKLFSERELPFIYRSHTVDDCQIQELNDLQNRLKKQKNTSRFINLLNLLKNQYPRAYYTRENKGHFGLGLEYYTHVTSPLRRAADNISNLCIDTFLLSDYTKEDMKRVIALIDEAIETINTKRKTIEYYEEEYALKKILENKQ